MKPLLLLLAVLGLVTAQGASYKALIVDGQNNHDYKSTTPHLKALLEETGLFTVDVVSTPPAKGDMKAFHPKFSEYNVVVSNYNGEPWSDETKADFEAYVKAFT